MNPDIVRPEDSELVKKVLNDLGNNMKSGDFTVKDASELLKALGELQVQSDKHYGQAGTYENTDNRDYHDKTEH